MGTTSQLNTDGTLKWKTKFDQKTVTPLVQSDTIFTNLTPCNIFSDGDVGIFVQKDGYIVCHFVIDNVVSFDINGLRITIFCKDHISYKLEFIDLGELQIANFRLDHMLNGEIFTAC